MCQLERSRCGKGREVEIVQCEASESDNGKERTSGAVTGRTDERVTVSRLREERDVFRVQNYRKECG